MNKWNLLPFEILEVVFNYVGLAVEISRASEVSVIFPTENILQCRLTCKHWNSLARSTFFRSITLKSLEQAGALFRTLHSSNSNIGSLVNYINFNFLYDTRKKQKLTISLFQRVACSFPNLKRMRCYFYFDPIVFKVIESERSKNNFLKLEALPDFLGKINENQYTNVACLFPQSLRELVIYDNEPKLFQDKERLKGFLNIDTLVFKLSDCSNVYVLDQYISQCPTVKCVRIYETPIVNNVNTTELWKTEINSYTHTCPQVERVEVIGVLFDIRIYNYLMKVFPNVKTFTLLFGDDNIDASVHLPTEKALQYLHHLINIPNVNVLYIPLDNINDTIMEFYDSSNTIKTLRINYCRNEQSFLIIFNSSKANRNAEIGVYYKLDELLAIPRNGFIEKSGINLQSLRIDMALNIDDMNMMAKNPDNPDLLSYLMQRCSNLKSISLESSLLYFKNSSAVKTKPISREFVWLFRSLIDPSFFSGLSYYAPYIAEFVISTCKFIGEEKTKNNISIDMPNTKFGRISYDDGIWVDNIYCKLVTTQNNNTVCYHGTIDNYKICEEIDYTKSLENERSLSIYIRCESILAINASSSMFGTSIEV